MNPALSQTELDLTVILGDSNKDFVAAHFEKLFLLFNVFFNDHATSAIHAERAFLAPDTKDNPNTFNLYQRAVDSVFRENPGSNCLTQLSTKTTLCFLLKELTDFRYVEIAELMGVDKNEVKNNIAAIRTELLKKAA